MLDVRDISAIIEVITSITANITHVACTIVLMSHITPLNRPLVCLTHF